ncbi:amidase family protein [Actinomadura terrae]|uniref:amidase family protein n=1 Tax=Actinomadura terrae TaxID=604353 RepID=UPI001FA6DD89|nr:amidase family protein [Actinomadura terrae]
MLRRQGKDEGFDESYRLEATEAMSMRNRAPRESGPPHTWTLVEAARLVGGGHVDSEEYTRTLLDRCAAHQHVNAFITLDPELVTAQARAADRTRPGASRPLRGVPLVIKDNLDVAGLPTTAGTAALRHVPQRDSGVWRRLAKAGAIVLGKTNMHELAYGITGDNAAFGPVLNPAAPGHLSGGSSSGTAAAVAACLVPAGLGTDTGGSVRVPAALCGIAGLRPTTGRYPGDGMLKISSTYDTAGVLARTVEDLRFLDVLLAAEAPAVDTARDKGPPRLLVLRDDADSQVTEVVDRCQAALRQSGVKLIDVRLDLPARDFLAEAVFPVPLYETWAGLNAYLAPTPLGPADLIERIAGTDVRRLLTPLLRGPVVTPRQYRDALRIHHDVAATMARTLAAHRAHAYLRPTTVLGAPPLGTGESVRLHGRDVPAFSTYVRNTALAPVAGWPSVTVPAGSGTAGLPVGLLLDGPPGSDRRLLAIAAHCARAWNSPASDTG